MSFQTTPSLLEICRNSLNIKASSSQIERVEVKLWNILQKLSTGSANVGRLCEDWWELSQDCAFIYYFDRFFKNEEHKKILIKSSILELSSISLIYLSNLQQNENSGVFMTLMKNIFLCIYQSFLIQLELLSLCIAKLRDTEEDNSKERSPFANKQTGKNWKNSTTSFQSDSKKFDYHSIGAKFKEILCKRKRKRLKNKDEIFTFLIKFNDLIEEGLRKICKGRFEHSKFFKHESINSVEDIKELSSYFSSYCKSTLWLIVDILDFNDYNLAREYLIKALDGVGSAIQMQKNNEEHYLSKVGGTGLGSDGYDDALPSVCAPFLPPIDGERYEYTLVLDLDETLVHYFQNENEGKCLIRPNTEDFLKEMSQYYEIVIFTAAMQDYADWVIDQIDPEGYIKYRLYRQHALPCGSIFLKDLSRIGREMSKMMIVDNVPENFQLQPDNGIFITSWFDDVEDTALNELIPILVEISRKEVYDVRAALRTLRNQMIDQINNGVDVNAVVYSL